MSESYKKKETQIQKYHVWSPLAFLHMSDAIVNTYLALGVMGGGLIGGVLLEIYLVKKDSIAAAQLCSDVMYYGMKLGGVSFIAYAFIRIVIMF